MQQPLVEQGLVFPAGAPRATDAGPIKHVAIKQTSSFGELSTSPSEPPTPSRASSKSNDDDIGQYRRTSIGSNSTGWGDYLRGIFGDSPLTAAYYSCCSPQADDSGIVDRRMAVSAMSSLRNAPYLGAEDFEELVPRSVGEATDLTFDSPPETPTRGGLLLMTGSKSLSDMGDTYTGQFEMTKDVPHGRGLFTAADGSTYKGQWEDGEKHGHGVYVHVDGTTFDGQWQQGAKHGIGLETWTDGTKYEGEYCYGVKEGTGVYRNTRGMEYIGGFCEDMMHGQGVLKFEDGRKYAGQWQQGQMHGHGRMEWPSGDVWEGTYERGQRSGFGALRQADGRLCTGRWFNGEPQGSLEWTDAEGRPVEDVPLDGSTAVAAPPPPDTTEQQEQEEQEEEKQEEEAEEPDSGEVEQI